MVKSLFPKLAVKPGPMKRVSNPKTDFLLNFRFITKAEHAQILLGNMAVIGGGKSLLNLNADHHITPIPTGVLTKLYKGRADDVNVHLLFGAPLPDPPTE